MHRSKLRTQAVELVLPPRRDALGHANRLQRRSIQARLCLPNGLAPRPGSGSFVPCLCRGKRLSPYSRHGDPPDHNREAGATLRFTDPCRGSPGSASRQTRPGQTGSARRVAPARRRVSSSPSASITATPRRARPGQCRDARCRTPLRATPSAPVSPTRSTTRPATRCPLYSPCSG
jgi:hypothetical protein